MPGQGVFRRRPNPPKPPGLGGLPPPGFISIHAAIAQTLPTLSQAATAEFSGGIKTSTIAQTFQAIGQTVTGTHL
jgi:hypothetical protein